MAYKLNYSTESINISGAYFSQAISNKYQTLYFVAKNNHQITYQYENNKWKKVFELSLIDGEEVVYIGDLLNDENYVIMATKKNKSVTFYYFANNCMNYLADLQLETDEKHKTILLGNVLDDEHYVGLLIQFESGKIDVYKISKKHLRYLEGKDAFEKIRDLQLKSLRNFKRKIIKIFLTSYENDAQENIIVHSQKELEVFIFHPILGFIKLFIIPHGSRNFDPMEKLYFTNISNSKRQDIVFFNSSGLFIHEFSKTKKLYELVHYNPLFSTALGWTKDHIDSIQFENLCMGRGQEMIFNSPQGILILTYDYGSKQWISLLENSNLSIQDKYSKVIKAIPVRNKYSKNPIILAQYNDELKLAQLVQNIKYIEKDNSPKTSVVHANITDFYDEIPEIRFNAKKNNEEKILLHLGDRLQNPSILTSVNQLTGRPKFVLPLFEVPSPLMNIRFGLGYDGSSQISSMLGVGWSLPQNNFIAVERSSIFTEDHKYYLIFQNTIEQLIFDLENSDKNLNILAFKLLPKNAKDSENSKNISVYYYQSKERWEISSGSITQIFGNQKTEEPKCNALHKELTWENWTGEGISEIGRINLTSAWYLSSIEDTSGNKINFTYLTETVSIPKSVRYVTETYLRDIKDNFGNSIRFIYEEKQFYENKLQPSSNPKTYLMSSAAQKRFLSSIAVITPTRRQNFYFDYSMIGIYRLLKGIREDKIQPTLAFEYYSHGNTYLLENVSYPSGANVNFSYSNDDQKKTITETTPFRYQTTNDYKILYGNDYTLISDVRKKEVVLKKFNSDMEDIDDSFSSLLFVSTCGETPEDKDIIEHEIIEIGNSVAIIIFTKKCTTLHLLYRNNDNWQITSTHYSFSKYVVIKFGVDFVVVKDTKSAVEIIYWDNDWKKEKLLIENQPTSAQNVLIDTDRTRIAIYDDEFLWVVYKNYKSQWESRKITKIPGLIKQMNNVLSKFGENNNNKDLFFRAMKTNYLQISKNLIALATIKIEYEYQLLTSIKVYVIDNQYKISNSHVFTIPKNDVRDLKPEFSFKEDSQTTLIKSNYKLENGKYKLNVTEFTGYRRKEIDSISNRNIRRQQEEKYVEMVRAYGEQYIFPLQIQKYNIFLYGQSITSEYTKYIFDGYNHFKKEYIQASSYRLGERYVLEKKTAESTFKIYDLHKRGKEVIDLNIHEYSQIQIRYPYYIAYQNNNDQIKVIEFKNEYEIERTPIELPVGEKLSFKSGYNVLITEKENFLIFRSKLKIRHLLPNPVVSSTQLYYIDEESNNDLVSRDVGYFYDIETAKIIDNTIQYHNTIVIPGNKKNVYGWITQSRISNEKIIYDKQGKIIKTIDISHIETEIDDSENDKDDIEDVNIHTILFDKTGKVEIAKFTPFEIDTEEVGYYGFEDYEINKIGKLNSTNQWKFNKLDIKKEQFSLTGKNYLYLENNILEGVFEPKHQNQVFVASCWIRPQKSESHKILLGEILPYLKAVVYHNNTNLNPFILLSEAKMESDDWFYFEVIIDLPYLKEIYLSQSKQKITINPNEVIFKIAVQVSPETNNSFDLDHIRFSPLNCPFEAYAYNYEIKQVSDTIMNVGLIQRFIYNQYDQQIASTNEYGQIEFLNTFTKILESPERLMKKSKQTSYIQIKPESGYIENFSPYAFGRRIKVSNANNWEISPNEIYHINKKTETLRFQMEYIDKSSNAIRFFYNLKSENCKIEIPGIVTLKCIQSDCTFNNSRKAKISNAGDILIVNEDVNTFIWVNGGLYYEGPANTSDLTYSDINIQGLVTIKDLIILNKPKVRVIYANPFGEKTQEISLENGKSALLVEHLYDELGRQAITTKPVRVEFEKTKSLLAYHANLITNRYLSSKNSIWKQANLEGEILNYGGNKYSFTQTKFYNNALDQVREIGFPGKKYNIGSPFAKHYAASTKNCYLNNLFPQQEEYTYRVEFRMDGTEEIVVFDRKKNKVAKCLHGSSNKNILHTYTYDENNKLVTKLPPMYHEKVTFENSKRLSQSFNTNETQKNILERLLATRMRYDKYGKLISKKTPDTGKIEHIYDKNGLLRFTIFYSNKNTEPNEIIKNVIYFKYDDRGRLKTTGTFSKISHKGILTAYLVDMTQNYEHIKEYQQFFYSDNQLEPTLRGRTRKTITFNDEEPLIEESVFNANQDTISKRYIVPVNNTIEHSISAVTPLVIEINKNYLGGKMKEVEYPFEINGKTLVITQQYNKLGKIMSIGMPNNNDFFASFTYNEAGQIENEYHNPQNFINKYFYNEPGYLTRIQSKYLTENIFYDAENSYDGQGYNDGTITKTEFVASWHQKAKYEQISLNSKSFITTYINKEQSELCYKKLQEFGYINKYGHQLRILYLDTEARLPIICSVGKSGYQITHILNKKGFPYTYGHRYDYGFSKELITAKYYIGKDTFTPFQPTIFATEINNGTISETDSNDIWNTLKSAGYLNFNAHSSDNYFILLPTINQLTLLNKNYNKFYILLQRTLISYFIQNKKLTRAEFSKLVRTWISLESEQNEIEEIISNIWTMLKKEGLTEFTLKQNFVQLLNNYKAYIPLIARILTLRVERQPGKTEYDVQLKDIDANGNQRIQSKGFNYYEIEYHEYTNQIKTIKLTSKSNPDEVKEFHVSHDYMGNVVKAEHNNITEIVYDKVSNRPTSIYLEDGTTVSFNYDAGGERALKKVTNPNGFIVKEIHYIRDEQGRCLVEREITYLSNDKSFKDVKSTAYIYGPRGLLGFIRRGEYYSVITDHEGSVRLVVKDGEVVAAFDYLPYGGLMREYISYPDANLSYRYTGQEWDEELHLYNYHARLYDPVIGRFYQIDPLDQYASPYKYAGNSPISAIDPDGEFVFSLGLLVAMGVSALFFGYMGSAAANNDWNPTNWDYSDKGTWIGMVMGVATGALLPLGFVSVEGTTVSILTSGQIALRATIGAGVSYLSVGGTTGEWDPSQWNFKSPLTWNALFNGFAVGSGAPSGFNSAREFFESEEISITGKSLVILASTAAFGVTFTLGGIQDNWDFKRPSMWYSLVGAITSSWDIPYLFKGGKKFLQRLRNGKFLTQLSKAGNMKKMFDILKNGIYNKQTLRYIVKAVLMTGLFTASGFDNDWDFSSTTTYSNLIVGFVMGAQLYGVYKAILGSYHGFYSEYTPEQIYSLSRRKIRAKEAIELIEKKHSPESQIDIDDLVKLDISIDELGITGTFKAAESTFIAIFDKSNTGESITALGSLRSGYAPMFQIKDLKNMFTLFGHEADTHESISLNSKARYLTLRTVDEIAEYSRKRYEEKKKLKEILEKSGLREPLARQLSEKVEYVVQKRGVIDSTTIDIINNNIADVEVHKSPLFVDVDQQFKTATQSNTNKDAISRITFDRNALLQNAANEIHIMSGRISERVWNAVRRTALTVNTWRRVQTPNVWNMIGNKVTVTARDLLPTLNFNVNIPIIKYGIYLRSRLPTFTNAFSLNIKINPAFVDAVSSDPVWSLVLNKFQSPKKFQKPFLRKIKDVKNVNEYGLINAATETTRLRRSIPGNISTTEEYTKTQKTTKFWSPRHLLNSVLQSLNGIKNSVKFQLNSTNDFNSNRYSQQVNASVNVNGTLTLIDLFIRKITGEKFISNLNDDISLEHAQAHSINILSKYENLLDKIATKNKISFNDLYYDAISILKQITYYLVNRLYSKIPEYFYETAKNLFPESIQNNKFSQTLRNSLKEMLTEYEIDFIPSTKFANTSAERNRFNHNLSPSLNLNKLKVQQNSTCYFLP